MSNTFDDNDGQPEDMSGVPSDVKEWVEIIDALDSQIKVIRKKVENGRVRDAENEMVRVKWNRLLTNALSTKIEALEVAPLTKIGKSEQEDTEGKAVYIVEGGGLYKIGCSQDIEERLKGLQAMSPVDIQLVYSSPQLDNGFLAEAEMHDEFSEYRTHGEWFDFPCEVLGDVIQSLQRRVSDTDDSRGAGDMGNNTRQ